MTNQEIIERLRMMKAAWIVTADTTPESQETAAWAAEAINGAISALKGPTREQVEKMRGEWEWFDEEVTATFGYYEREWGWRCSKCGVVLPDDFDNPDDSPAMRFCQWCGAPMTDEAVDMVMERLEALHSETKAD